MRPEVRPAAGLEEVTAALALRHQVFCDEQGVPLADELDGRDGEAVHLVAMESGGVIGTCRVLVEGASATFGRLAVARPARRRGIGSALLAAAEQEARRAGAKTMVLAAQLDARELYIAAGYEERGAVFLDAGIDHVTMERALA